MIKNYKNKFVGMSLVTAMLLGSSAYAGKIIGVDANASYEATTPPTQHGFGGWNLDNVIVKITDLDFNEIAKTFDPTNGTYDIMEIGDTFESEISTGGEIRGLLHGKNWPVGEPAGIKVVNDDNGTLQSGKSSNCIMTTSYLDEVDSGTGESGYLNIYDTNPDGIAVPTVCSSPFQSHKRFKVNMQPSTVAGVAYDTYGKPFELTFNLDQTDTNATVRRYQVFSKINNYTGVRLDGYKVELLDENGTEVNASNLIKFSLDLTTKTSSEDESGYEAVFAHGLWGPTDKHFPENGFFDGVRAGFVQDGNNTQILTGGTTFGTMGSNYVDLFGIWLPSKWAPYGVFFDDDNDSTTDAVLIAFWGTAPNAAAGTLPAWHYGKDYNLTDGDQSWAEPTIEELSAWMADPLYSVAKIEDTLNLGLNYVVEIGLNSTIGKTFTIRITPHIAPEANQTAPSYIDANGDYIMPQTDYNNNVTDVNITDVNITDGTTTDVATTLVTSSSSGGGCTYNPDSKNSEMSFLFMMALGLLYPLRRRFIK